MVLSKLFLWGRCKEISDLSFSIRLFLRFRHRINVFAGLDSFFRHSHLSLMQWSLILFHWSTKTPSQQIQTLTGLSEKTIIKVLSGIRTICSIKIGQDNIRLGGPGIIIEIDESKFGACQKYHRGRASHGPWVFGMVERTSHRVFLFRVPNRKRLTLLPIIQEYVLPGTTIISDEFTPYHILNDVGYDHLRVNHSQNFVDPDTGAHTNTIEGVWGHVKRKLKNMNGTSNNSLPSYLDEFMWFKLYNGDSMMNILSHISDAYPL